MGVGSGKHLESRSETSDVPGRDTSGSQSPPQETIRELTPQAPRDERQPPSPIPSLSRDARGTQDEDAHFVGDLNPESTFFADSPETTGGYREAGAIGVWVSRRTLLSTEVPSGTVETPRRSLGPPRLPGAVASDHCLAKLPTERHYIVLKRIYMRDVHTIFPALNIEVLSGQKETATHILYKQVVCLAAGAHPDAKPHLMLGDSPDLMSYADFSQQLISSIRTAINDGLVRDRIQIIPVLVILSLCAYSAEDRHLSAELAALAVSYVQTVGLHLQAPATSPDPEYFERLFCCVWAMDRLTAAFHGRPILIHERDVGRDMQGCFDRQETRFRLLLEIVALLDRAIRFYRPTAGGGAVESDGGIPSLEELVQRTGAFGVESRLLVTLELLYHAVVILYCRAPSPSPPTRRISDPESLSSITITTIFTDFAGRIPYLSFVPYSASLALRTTYRELRASTVPTLRARSYARLRANCRILRALGEMYRPASAMVDIVDRLTREVDRVSAAVVAGGGQDVVEGTARAGVSDEPRVDTSVSSFVDPTFSESLARVNFFESLEPEFDFGALDMPFGDGIHSDCGKVVNSLPIHQHFAKLGMARSDFKASVVVDSRPVIPLDIESKDNWKEGNTYSIDKQHSRPVDSTTIGPRLQQMSWSWFTLTMSTGGLALVLDRTPHQFHGLSIIGRIVFILNLVFFCFVAGGLTYRFTKNPRALRKSLLHPTESLFFPTCLLSIATILSESASYGTPHVGSWLPEALYFVFWLYVGISVVSAIVQYSLLFGGANLTVHSMTPTWLLPIFPAMLAGTLASATAPLQGSSRSMTMCVAGITAQGLGWTVACLIYPLYLARLMQHGLPAPGMRPTMFIAVGPPGFTALATIGIAQALPADSSYFIENPRARETLQTVATWLGIWIWAIGFWFFSLSLVAVLSSVYKKQLEFSMGWWAFVFPNVGFTISTAVLGEQLGSTAHDFEFNQTH
ncbi:uncharacterized protein DNG_08935 [Cephalotrichum gorgonifer]|uniref:Xylanolytic transcriptional activator regulatory domain-containing protein n=1 Tax=Cephalotrichum gorgonifer TaxID=2041049 RepID=A0AAE8N4L1_9PEZI|nr:uncharacterized protein DNG_08935 [Cephalotrichum gorgonifer]